MNHERLQRVLGWGSVGSGLVLLAFADPLRRLLRVRGQSMNLRLAGTRDVVIGLGLVRGRDRRPWLWARSVSEVLDTSWLWKTVREHPRGSGRRAAVGVGALGLTLVDFSEVLRGSVPGSSGHVGARRGHEQEFSGHREEPVRRPRRRSATVLRALEGALS